LVQPAVKVAVALAEWGASGKLNWRDRESPLQSASNEATERPAEQRYRCAAENISDVIWSTDPGFSLELHQPSVKPCSAK